MAARAAALQPGDVLLLPESEYLYGIGPVIARIHAVHGQVQYRDETWWHATGEVANGDPTNHGGFTTRDLYVRHASLSRTRRTPRT